MAGRAGGVTGEVAPGWQDVRDAFAAAQADDPGGAQLAVHHRGRLVVDLAAAGEVRTPRPFDTGSLGVVMSVTKGVLAICVHLLVERGLLDVTAPVAAYWPEYARHGKDATTVADLLTHSAGVVSFAAGPEDVDRLDLLDRRACVRALEEARPLWRPGTACLYHALTFGHLVGEVVRRVTGTTVGRFVAAEIAGPSALDLWIGLPAEEEHRFVPQHSPAGTWTPERVRDALATVGLTGEDPPGRALVASAVELGRVTAAFAGRAGRAAEIPAAGGIANARSLSRLYATVIGHVDGVRLMSPLTVERARVPRTDGLGDPAPLRRPADAPRSRFGLGFELPNPALPMLGEGSFGHAGAGGRLGLAHPESGLSVAYTCTDMRTGAGPDPRWLPWTNAVLAAAR